MKCLQSWTLCAFLVPLLALVQVPSASGGIDQPNQESLYNAVREIVAGDMQINGAEAFAYVHGLSHAELLRLTEETAGAKDRRLYFGLAGLVMVERLKDTTLPPSLIVGALETGNISSFGRYFLLWALHVVLPSLSAADQQLALAAAEKSIAGGNGVLFEERLAAVAVCNRAVADLANRGHIDRETVVTYGGRLAGIVATGIENPELRRAAVNGIAEIGFTDAAPLLIETLPDAMAAEHDALTRSTCLALARLEADRAIAPIGRILAATEDEYVYASAAVALGQLEGLEALEILMRHDDRFAGDHAGCAIRELDATLFSLLETGSPRHLLADAIGAIGATRHFYREKQVATCKRLLREILLSTDNDVTLFVTASDPSGIHYIKYSTNNGNSWGASFTQPQHPNSDSLTASFKFTLSQSGWVHYYAMDNGGNYPVYSESIWINIGQDPSPDIKVNGQDGPLNISHTETAAVTISLDPGGQLNDPADWWVYAVQNSSAMFWWKYPAQWKKSVTPIRAVAALLQVVNGHSVYLGSLPAGSYVFTFAVDAQNNVLEGTYADEVIVTVN